jgi:hypothetical protein
MAAAGLTWLQLINRVLVRLRESTVANNNTTEYSTHVGQVINQVKSEIEEAYYWNALRETFTVNCVAATTNYALADSGPRAIVLSAWNTATYGEMVKSTNRDFDAKFFGVATVQTGNPTQYLQAGTNASNDITVDIWPSPTGTDALKFNAYVPQADLAADGDVALIPQNVLIEETVARMQAEKGDEGAQPLPPGQSFYRTDLLASAVSREAALDDNEMQWEPE